MTPPARSLILVLLHHLARGLALLPPRVQAGIGRRIERPEGVPPAPDVALLLTVMRARGDRALGEGDDLEARRRQSRHGSAIVLPRRRLPVRAQAVAVAGAEGPLRGRLYLPAAPTDGRLLIYYHGGGWVTGDLDTHDGVCRLLAHQAATRVLAVDYRLAPEHPFPAPVDDALAAFADVVARCGEFGAHPARISVAGDSAGGNLAAVVSQQTAGGPRPAAALLLYPGTDFEGHSASQDLFAEGFLLEQQDIDWFKAQYLPPDADVRDPRASPIFGDLDDEHPPVVVVTAGFDPLRDEGETYAHRLRDAGIPVVLRRQPGLIHGFANLTAVSPSSHDAMVDCASALLALQEVGARAQVAASS